jgi:hypothetical protein
MSAHAGDSHGSNAGGRRMSTIRITVNIIENDGQLAPPKLADAEVHFTSGELGGLTLFGFAVWRAADGGQNVTFSSRQFRVRGQRRSFSMLRWIAKREAQERLADVVLRAYRRHRLESAED